MKLTAKKIIIDWLKTKRGQTIASHDVQLSAMNYGKNMYGVLFSPDSYSRIWREIREDYKTLENIGIKVKEITFSDGAEKQFLIT